MAHAAVKKGNWSGKGVNLNLRVVAYRYALVLWKYLSACWVAQTVRGGAVWCPNFLEEERHNAPGSRIKPQNNKSVATIKPRRHCGSLRGSADALPISLLPGVRWLGEASVLA